MVSKGQPVEYANTVRIGCKQVKGRVHVHLSSSLPPLMWGFPANWVVTRTTAEIWARGLHRGKVQRPKAHLLCWRGTGQVRLATAVLSKWAAEQPCFAAKFYLLLLCRAQVRPEENHNCTGCHRWVTDWGWRMLSALWKRIAPSIHEQFCLLHHICSLFCVSSACLIG